MTNLIAAAIISLTITNWKTVSVTSPVRDNPFTLEMRYETHNQIGLVQTNVVALVEWKGEVKQFVLESTHPVVVPGLTRSVEKAVGGYILNSVQNAVMTNVCLPYYEYLPSNH